MNRPGLNPKITPFIADSGQAGGVPLIFFHGFPGTHKQGQIFEPWAAEFDLRILCPDRPGYGDSPARSGSGLMDFIQGLEVVLDQKKIDRFYLVGVSGGNPAAVCAAEYFGPRVLALGSICGLAPYAENRDDFSVSIRRAFDLARRTPEVLLRMILNPLVRNFNPTERLTQMIGSLAPVDQEVLEDPVIMAALLESMDLALKQGPAGIIFDLKSFSSPWPVDLTKIKCPHFLWHGEQDHILPASMSRYLSDRIPHSKLRLFPTEGHYSLPIRRAREVLKDLTSLQQEKRSTPAGRSQPPTKPT